MESLLQALELKTLFGTGKEDHCTLSLAKRYRMTPFSVAYSSELEEILYL